MTESAPDAGLELGDRRPRAMAQSVAYDEEGSPNLFRNAAAAIFVAVVALFGWAGFLGVDDTVAVPGAVVTAGEVKTIRHPDGGTVAEVLIKDGDVVETGQTLMRLKSSDIGERLNTLKVRRVGVGLLVAQLKALAGGGEPEFSFAPPEFKDMVEKEKVVYEGLKEIVDKRRQEVEGQIASLKKEIADIDKRHAALSKSTDILEEEMQFREELLKKGLTDKGVYNETKKQVEQAYKELADLTAERQKATKNLTVAETRLRAYQTRLRGRVLAELTNANQVLEDIGGSAESLQERKGRLTVVAPAAGVVRSAGLPAPGAAIEPGAAIMDIVPSFGVVAVEARIDPADVKRLAVGSPVTIKAAPGAGRFAGLAGRLIEISPAVSSDDKGRAYHLARIAFGGTAARLDASRLPPPGTAVVASVRMGSSRLYEYLWRKITGGTGIANRPS